VIDAVELKYSSGCTWCSICSTNLLTWQLWHKCCETTFFQRLFHTCQVMKTTMTTMTMMRWCWRWWCSANQMS